MSAQNFRRIVFREELVGVRGRIVLAELVFDSLQFFGAGFQLSWNLSVESSAYRESGLSFFDLRRLIETVLHGFFFAASGPSGLEGGFESGAGGVDAGGGMGAGAGVAFAGNCATTFATIDALPPIETQAAPTSLT